MMANRYIDADEAVRTAIKSCVEVVGHGITQFDAMNIVDAMEQIPTADVVPRETIEQIFEELLKAFCERRFVRTLEELKKKYTEDQNNENQG